MFNKIFLASLFMSVIVLFNISLPLDAQASGLVPCGHGNSKDDRCTMCHLLVLAQNIIKTLRNWIFITAVVVIAIAGVIYIVSVGNQTMTSMAKTAIKAALLGAIIILVAWLAISTIMYAMALKDDAVKDSSGNGLILERAGSGMITNWKFKCQ